MMRCKVCRLISTGLFLLFRIFYSSQFQISVGEHYCAHAIRVLFLHVGSTVALQDSTFCLRTHFSA